MHRTLVSVLIIGVVAGVFWGCERVTKDLQMLSEGAKKERLPPTVTSGNVDIGGRSQYPAGSANARFDEMYGFVVTNDSGAVLAIRTVCTHDGHFVEWKPSGMRFVCSYERCEYDLKGAATHAPAFKSLNSVPASKSADGNLMVDLDKLYAKPVPFVAKK